MSSAAAPRRIRFPLLLYGAVVAPIFWLGQLMLGYAVTAVVCFPGDHPVTLAWPALGGVLTGFNVVAILAAVSGALVSLRSLSTIRRNPRLEASLHFTIAEGRARFLAIWGIFSSFWFLSAILFNIIAAITVPPCVF